MAKSGQDTACLLPAARAGSQEALGQLLQACRRYLLALANRQIEPKLRAKGGASDVVQLTFLEAQRDFARFQGESEVELLAWLRQLLLHSLANFRRHYRSTGKRCVEREVSRGACASAADPAEQLVADTPSPSKQVIAHEEGELLRAALARLPEEYRQVIALHHQEQCSFEEIGKRLNRSTSGARLLWLRAIERLEQELEASP